jgi:hypothetical protein
LLLVLNIPLHYYSSMLRSRGFNPVCVGIPRSIPQVPSYVVDEPREEAAAQGHDLRQFKYACAGYSMFVVDNKDGRSGEKEGKTLLPYCQGLEVGFHLVVINYSMESQFFSSMLI